MCHTMNAFPTRVKPVFSESPLYKGQLPISSHAFSLPRERNVCCRTCLERQPEPVYSDHFLIPLDGLYLQIDYIVGVTKPRISIF